MGTLQNTRDITVCEGMVIIGDGVGLGFLGLFFLYIRPFSCFGVILYAKIASSPLSMLYCRGKGKGVGGFFIYLVWTKIDNINKRQM